MVNFTALAEYYLEKGDIFNWTNSFEPSIAAYVPWSFPCYFALLLATYCVKQILGPKFVVGQQLQFLHNMFLVVQSAALVLIIQVLYFETSANINAAKSGKYTSDGSNNPFSFMGFVENALESPLRFKTKWFGLGMWCFSASKLYEALDTVILIINEKPLIMLHVWHHATTFIAFYVGQFTGAAFWIGWWNSFIHVIMYCYYAKVPGMKTFAKYITSLQLMHLFGGAVCNFYTLLSPVAVPKGTSSIQYSTTLGPNGDVDVRQYSIFNACICLSYFTLFLAFYSRKYDKSGKGSIYSLLGAPKGVQKLLFSVQRLFLSPNGKMEKYLVNQGVVIPEIAVADAKKKE